MHFVHIFEGGSLTRSVKMIRIFGMLYRPNSDFKGQPLSLYVLSSYFRGFLAFQIIVLIPVSCSASYFSTDDQSIRFIDIYFKNRHLSNLLFWGADLQHVTAFPPPVVFRAACLVFGIFFNCGLIMKTARKFKITCIGDNKLKG